MRFGKVKKILGSDGVKRDLIEINVLGKNVRYFFVENGEAFILLSTFKLKTGAFPLMHKIEDVRYAKMILPGGHGFKVRVINMASLEKYRELLLERYTSGGKSLPKNSEPAYKLAIEMCTEILKQIMGVEDVSEDSNAMAITLEIAREMYGSGSEKLKSFAKMFFSEDELVGKVIFAKGEMCEDLSVRLFLGKDEGNSTETDIQISLPTGDVVLEKNSLYSTSKLYIKLFGIWERNDLVKVFGEILSELGGNYELS